jgi:hypothetical protein
MGIELQKPVFFRNPLKMIMVSDSRNGSIVPGCGLGPGCCYNNYATTGNMADFHGGGGNAVHVDSPLSQPGECSRLRAG